MTRVVIIGGQILIQKKEDFPKEGSATGKKSGQTHSNRAQNVVKGNVKTRWVESDQWFSNYVPQVALRKKDKDQTQLSMCTSQWHKPTALISHCKQSRLPNCSHNGLLL
jgi:hypothetical protein